MNVTEMLDASHLLVFQVLEDLPETGWEIPGACGDWTVKDIIAHLSSHEYVLIDALKTFSGDEPTASLLSYIDDAATFNDKEVEARKYETAQHVEDEYQEVQLQSAALLAGIPSDVVMRDGTMPWSHTNQSLAEFIQTLCDHIREHCEQIAAFCERHKL
jgi:hypothetical protein